MQVTLTTHTIHVHIHVHNILYVMYVKIVVIKYYPYDAYACKYICYIYASQAYIQHLFIKRI